MTSAFFHRKSANFVTSSNTDIDCIWYIISNSFNLFWVFKDFLDKHACNFDDVSKNGFLDLLEINVIWNKGYDVIIYVHDVINQVLLRDLNHIVDVVMWPKFGNSSIYMREVN